MIDKVPVLFIIFNRLGVVERVFAQIKEYKPKQLFIACDGGRIDRENETEQCKKVQNYVLSQVDWECEVKTNFLDENLGPAKAVSKFLFWFFDNVEYGIILEHDCLAHRDFFDYCAELLVKYKDDDRIATISGYNVLGKEDIKESYYFTYTQQLWGWAAWKRTLEGYDIYMKDYSLKEFRKNIKPILHAKNERLVFMDKFLSMKKQRYNTWDMQLLYYSWRKRRFNIEPNCNLVSNIGFDEQGENCKDPNHFLANNKTYSILPLQHPQDEIRWNKISDEKIYMKYWYKSKVQLMWRFVMRNFIMKRKF